MNVRIAGAQDLEALLLLYQHLHENDVNVTAESLRKTWDAITTNREFFTYVVAEENGKIIATANVSLIPNLTRGGRSIALIENVVTHKDFRRRGAGKRVIAEAIEIARRNNCYKIMLMTNVLRKEAHRFYEHLGFSAVDKQAFVMKLI